MAGSRWHWFSAPRALSWSAAALALAACGSGEPAGSPAPNVLLVSVDTLRADATSPYGGHFATPTFAAVARSGTLFEWAFSAGSSTAPSHASLFTGLAVPRHAVIRNGDPLAADRVTIAEKFLQQGYRTAAFVSSWVMDPRFGWSQGFEVYDAEFPAAGSTMDKNVAYQGAIWVDREFDGLDRRAAATTNAARGWLADVSHEGSQPWFLFVHYFDPHGPYVPPAPYARREPTRPFELSHLAMAKHAAGRKVLHQIRMAYHREVLYVDAAIHTLLETVEQASEGRPTLIVMTADHGEGLGDHGAIEHGLNLYDEAVRVPLLFQWLGETGEGSRITTPVSGVDVAPTILELAGLPQLANADGHSLADSVAQGIEPDAHPVLLHRRPYDPPHQGESGSKVAVRSSNWKLIRDSNGVEEIFDLAADPAEARNIASGRPDAASELRIALDRYLSEMPEIGELPSLPDEVRGNLEALGYTE